MASILNEQADSPTRESTSKPRGEPTNRTSRWRYAIPLIPWLWFAVRGLHPWFEYAAIGLPLGVICVAVFALRALIRTRSMVWAGLLVSSVLFFLVAVFGPWRPIAPATLVEGTEVRVASVNLGLYWYSNNDVGYYLDRTNPDFVFGTELTESHDIEFRSRFEHVVSDVISLERQRANDEGADGQTTNYRRFGLPSMGLYSHLPFEVLADPIPEFDGGLPGVRARVETPSGPMIVYGLHVPKAWPRTGPYQVSSADHVELARLIAAAVDREEHPTIVIGDLNMVDRSTAYRTMTTSLTDGMRQSGWAVPTVDRGTPLNLFFARIDHLLLSEPLCATDGVSEDTRYSDHRPLFAVVGICKDA